ncbi:MAG: hypothetical protein ACRELX_16110, partial [Longimicrobiales bacterium]
ARKRGRGGRTAPAAAATFDPAALGLPTDASAVTEHLVGYKGVGQRSAEALVEAFGAGGVFPALETEPERVKEILGTRRGESVLDAFRSDVEERAAGAPADVTATATAAEVPQSEAEAEPAATERKSRRGRGRRGGRRGRKAGTTADKE